jgi:hypothetical protein
MNSNFCPKKFIVTTLIVSIWVNISEVFRFFVIVLPKMREQLSMIPEIGSVSLLSFSIWGIWAEVLTALVVFMFWLIAQRFGNTVRNAILAGTVSWLFFFVLFWVAQVNLGLASVSLAAAALPLAWIEMVVASWIASRLYARV